MSASNQHSRLIEDMRDAVAYAAGLDVAGWEPHMRYSEIAERFDVAARGLEEQLEALQQRDRDRLVALERWAGEQNAGNAFAEQVRYWALARLEDSNPAKGRE